LDLQLFINRGFYISSITFLIEQAVAVAGPKTDAIVLRRIMRGRNADRGFQSHLAGDVAYNGDGEDAVAMHLAACGQNPFQKSLFQRRAADACVSAQRYTAPSSKRSEGFAHAPDQFFRENCAVDASNIISSEDCHILQFTRAFKLFSARQCNIRDLRLRGFARDPVHRKSRERAPRIRFRPVEDRRDYPPYVTARTFTSQSPQALIAGHRPG
jgi:hypothetical protein